VATPGSVWLQAAKACGQRGEKGQAAAARKVGSPIALRTGSPAGLRS
jgi:hypothetical protein